MEKDFKKRKKQPKIVKYREVFDEIYIVGTIRELSVFEEGQVTTYPYKNLKNRQKS